MGHFGWTDAFHKQHYSRVIWSTLWYWIRKQINIWREKGGLRGHQKSIHQSNHVSHMHIENWRDVYWWSNKKKQFYCWIIITFPCLFGFMKLNGICSTWLNDRAFSFFLEWMTCLYCERSWRNNYSRRGFKVHLSTNIQVKAQRNQEVGIIYREGRQGCQPPTFTNIESW